MLSLEEIGQSKIIYILILGIIFHITRLMGLETTAFVEAIVNSPPSLFLTLWYTDGVCTHLNVAMS